MNNSVNYPASSTYTETESDPERTRIKTLIHEWLKYDNTIKEYTAKLNEFKNNKKQLEQVIIRDLDNLGGDFSKTKLDIDDIASIKCVTVKTKKGLSKKKINELLSEVIMQETKDANRTANWLKLFESKREIVEKKKIKRYNL